MSSPFSATGAFQERFEDAKEAADFARQFIHDALCNLKIPFPFPTAYSTLAYSLIITLGVIYALVTSFLVFAIAPLASAVLKIVADIRKAGLPELNEIAAEAMGELLGVDFPTANLTNLTNKDPQLDSARKLGELLHQRLVTEFVGAAGVTPKSGEQAAQAFSGYVTRFGVSNALLSIIGDVASLDHLTQLRELGVEVAQNLGLGRMHRRAIQPLIDATITKPYTRELSARYRTDRLSDIQYVNALQSGRLDEKTLRTNLAEKGFREEDITELIAQLEQRTSDSDLEAILRWQATQGNALPAPGANGQFSLSDLQRLNPDQAVQVLKNRGMSEETARQRLVAIGLQGAKATVERYAAEVERLAVHGFIDVEAARSLMQGLPLSPEELKYRMALIGLQLENPRKTLTLVEMETAYVDGVVTLGEWDAWLQGQGYSIADKQTLTFLLQIKADAASHKKAGHPAALTFAEISSAFVDGFIDLAQAQAWMHSKGYSAHDQTVLTQLLQAKKAKARPVV